MIDIITTPFVYGLVVSGTFAVVGLLVRYGKDSFNLFGR
jgi:hypothetical protein